MSNDYEQNQDNEEYENEGSDGSESSEDHQDVNLYNLRADDSIFNKTPDDILADLSKIIGDEESLAKYVVALHNTAKGTKMALSKQRNEYKTLKAKSKESSDSTQKTESYKSEDQIKSKIQETQLSKQLLEVKQSLQDKEAKLQDYERLEKKRTIENAIRGQLSGVKGLRPSAVNDILMYADKFAIHGDQVYIDVYDDSQGDYVPMSPSDWVQSMKTSREHWFIQDNFGGGARGGRPAQKVENVFALGGAEGMLKKAALQRDNPALFEQQRKDYEQSKRK
jgi:hypothetical protein